MENQGSKGRDQNYNCAWQNRHEQLSTEYGPIIYIWNISEFQSFEMGFWKKTKKIAWTERKTNPKGSR